MNEKIRELAEQATIRKFDGTGTDMGKLVLDEQKFAELIVEEATDLVRNMLDQNTAGEVIVEIKQHFGVL